MLQVLQIDHQYLQDLVDLEHQLALEDRQVQLALVDLEVLVFLWSQLFLLAHYHHLVLEDLEALLPPADPVVLGHLHYPLGRVVLIEKSQH